MNQTTLPTAYSALSLHGKVALITGGSSGIGAATARLFAARGAKVVIAARREKQSTQLIDELIKDGGEAFYVKCDVTKESDIEAAVAATVEKYGRLDIAFNNAGVLGPRGLTHEQTGESIKGVLDTNVIGVYLSMKYEIRQFLKQQQAEGEDYVDVTKLDHNIQPNEHYKKATRYSIINNASIFGEQGLPMYSAYSASKHAVIGLTKSAAMEYAKTGIRINAINYGFIASEITGSASVAFMLPMVPVGRLGQGAEAAEVVAWFASDASSFVTGSALECDGGYSGGRMNA